jgi:hypothetical protein
MRHTRLIPVRRFARLAGLAASIGLQLLAAQPAVADVIVRDHRAPIITAPAAGLRIGERVYNVDKSAFATIIGLEANGRFVLRFESGFLSGQTGGNWSASDLAILRGCSRDLCVGEEVYNVAKSARAKVLGLQLSGKYVLEFVEGFLAGQHGGNWDRSDLAAERGCSLHGLFCVGSQAYHVSKGVSVTVIAIQTNGKMALRFDQGFLSGQTGGNWDENDLAITAGTISAGHPGPGYPPNITQPPVIAPPVVVPPANTIAACTTESRGRHFRATAPSFGQARMSVIAQCQRDPYTDKAECQRMSQCR